MNLIHTFSKKLADEIDFRFELMIDYAEQEGEAVPALDRVTVYDIMRDIEGSDYWSQFKRECIDWQLAQGVYRIVSQAEYDSVVTLGSKAKAYPLHRGQRITFEQHLTRA